MTKIAAVPDNPDLTSAADLRAEVESFNHAADMRGALSDYDRTLLDQIASRTQTFLASSAGIASDVPSVDVHRSKIAAEVDRYIRLTSGQTAHEVAGEKIAAPSIESAAVRLALQRVGDGVLADIDKYVAARKIADEREAKKWQDWTAGFNAAIQIPSLRQAMFLWIECRKLSVDLPVQSALEVMRNLAVLFEDRLPAGTNIYTLTEVLKRHDRLGLIDGKAA